MGWTLVTGGAKRLGKAICLSLAEKGHAIVVHYNQSESEALQVVRECQERGVESQAVSGDFSSHQGVLEFLEALKRKEITVNNLVNNVGNFIQASPLETNVEEWEALFQTNFFAPLSIIQGLIPSIKAEKGSIINIGSAGLIEKGIGIKYSAYLMTKKSLYYLTKSLAKELAKDHVRVNMVSPGELVNSITLEQNREKLPMKRAASLSEVVRIISLLMDKESEYITGQNIEVAGGYAL